MSQSPISISWVSVHLNKAHETSRTKSTTEIWGWRNDTPNAIGYNKLQHTQLNSKNSQIHSVFAVASPGRARFLVFGRTAVVRGGVGTKDPRRRAPRGPTFSRFGEVENPNMDPGVHPRIRALMVWQVYWLARRWSRSAIYVQCLFECRDVVAIVRHHDGRWGWQRLYNHLLIKVDHVTDSKTARVGLFVCWLTPPLHNAIPDCPVMHLTHDKIPPPHAGGCVANVQVGTTFVHVQGNLSDLQCKGSIDLSPEGRNEGCLLVCVGKWAVGRAYVLAILGQSRTIKFQRIRDHPCNFPPAPSPWITGLTVKLSVSKGNFCKSKNFLWTFKKAIPIGHSQP